MPTPPAGAHASRPDRARRQALARLGLGAAVAYVAPAIVHLDRSANAAVTPTPCPPGKSKKAGTGCPPV
jgi:hypothetical protein